MNRVRRLLRRAARVVVTAVIVFVLLSIAWVGLYRVVDPPGTLLMAIRRVEGTTPIQYRPVPLERMAPALVHAVTGAEDSRFCRHLGVDVDAVEAALERNRDGGALRGASTISMQVAKNAFLWPDRTWARKGAELWFTLLVEALWPKRRVMEVYLNIAEWGPGIFGAEAAARHWFAKPAAALTGREAAMLAAVLPSPLKWDPAAPGPYVARRGAILAMRAEVVRRDGLADCVLRAE